MRNNCGILSTECGLRLQLTGEICIGIVLLYNSNKLRQLLQFILPGIDVVYASKCATVHTSRSAAKDVPNGGSVLVSSHQAWLQRLQ